jgi:hypothetical protein
MGRNAIAVTIVTVRARFSSYRTKTKGGWRGVGARSRWKRPFDFPTGGFSPPEGRSARGFKPPAFSRFLFQSAVESAETF